MHFSKKIVVISLIMVILLICLVLVVIKFKVQINNDHIDTLASNLEYSNQCPIKKGTDGKFYYYPNNRREEYSAFDVSQNVVFPGAVIDGGTIGTKNLKLINGDRKPITLIIPNNFSFEVNKINYANFTSTLKNELKQAEEIISPAHGRFITQESSAYNSTSINANVKASQGSTEGQIDFQLSKSNMKTNMKVYYEQVYYTINIEQPSKLSDLFDDITSQNIGDYQPAYISSVQYGRVFEIGIMSEEDKNTISAALSACSNIDGINVEGQIGIKNVEILNKCTFISETKGGKDLIKQNSFQGFLNAINNETDDAALFAIPLKYTINYINDKKEEGIPISDDSTVLKVKLNDEEIKLELLGIDVVELGTNDFREKVYLLKEPIKSSDSIMIGNSKWSFKELYEINDSYNLLNINGYNFFKGDWYNPLDDDTEVIASIKQQTLQQYVDSIQ